MIEQQDSIGQEEMQIGRVYSIEFKDCCIAGRFTARLINTRSYQNVEPSPYNVYQWIFENGVILDTMDVCIIREVKDVSPANTFSKTTVENALKRLVSYYGDRARVAAKQTKEAVDCQSACVMANVAARWEARRDGVLQVAENLDIELQEEKPARDLDTLQKALNKVTLEDYWSK